MNRISLKIKDNYKHKKKRMKNKIVDYHFYYSPYHSSYIKIQ